MRVLFIVAGGESATADIHCLVIYLLHLFSMKVAVAFFGKHIAYQPSLSIEIVSQLLGFVFRISFLKNRILSYGVESVFDALGKEYLGFKTDAHETRFEVHLFVIDLCVVVEINVFGVEKKRQRVVRRIVNLGSQRGVRELFGSCGSVVFR